MEGEIDFENLKLALGEIPKDVYPNQVIASKCLITKGLEDPRPKYEITAMKLLVILCLKYINNGKATQAKKREVKKLLQKLTRTDGFSQFIKTDELKRIILKEKKGKVI